MICWNCETKNTDKDTFCLECGKLLNYFTSDEQVDPTYNRIFNITRKDFTSKEFSVIDNNKKQFKIHPVTSPHDFLYTAIFWILFIIITFGSMLLFIYLNDIDYFVFTNGFLAIGLIIGFCTVFYSPLLLIPIVNNEQYYTEIDKCDQNQVIGNVKARDMRHHKWKFTTNKDGKAKKKYTMKLTTKTTGIINIDTKNQYNHTYHFTRTEKGSAPEIDLYIDKKIVLKLLLGPEYESMVDPLSLYKVYGRKGFQILAQDVLNDDLVLFFATVLSNKFKTRNVYFWSKSPF